VVEQRLLLWVYAITAPYVIALWLRRRSLIGVRLPLTMGLLAAAAFVGLFVPGLQTAAFWVCTGAFLLFLVLPGVLVRIARRLARARRYAFAHAFARCARVLLPAMSLDREASLYRALRDGGSAVDLPWPEAAPRVRARDVPATTVLTLLILVAHAVVSLAGESDSALTLLDFGASYGPLVRDGDLYRLITAVFLHIGLLHLVFNAGAIWILGRWTEPLMSGSRVVLVFFAGGALGYVASFLHYGDAALSAGASGGAMALVGCALAVFGRMRESAAARQRQKSLLLVIGATLLVGILEPGMDNGAHIGGLVTGILLGMLFTRVRTSDGAVRWAAAAVSLTALACFVWLAADFRDWRRPLPFAADRFALERPAAFGLPAGGPEWDFPGAPLGEFSVILEDGERSPEDLLKRRLAEIREAIIEEGGESPEVATEDVRPVSDPRECWRGTVRHGPKDGGVRYDVYVLPEALRAAVLTFSFPGDDDRLRREITSGVLRSFRFR
jgi:membrane associated rhomboid family serine protease